MLTTSLIASIAGCAAFAFLIVNRSLVAHLWRRARCVPGTESPTLDVRTRSEVAGLWSRNRWIVLLACVVAGFGLVLGTDLFRQERRLVAFTYIYPLGETAGPRAWSIDDLGHWQESGPTVRTRLFDVVKRTVANACHGYSVNESRAPRFVFFIPDDGCETMSLLMSRDGNAWTPLGPITSETVGTRANR